MNTKNKINCVYCCVSFAILHVTRWEQVHLILFLSLVSYYPFPCSKGRYLNSLLIFTTINSWWKVMGLDTYGKTMLSRMTTSWEMYTEICGPLKLLTHIVKCQRKMFAKFRYKIFSIIYSHYGRSTWNV